MIDDLRKLIEAVEAGDLSATNNSLGVMYSGLGNYWPWDWLSKINSAFRGSLDAAIALYEALLPGWVANIWTDGYVDLYETPHSEHVRADVVGNPARALLLAVLRAKLMEAENDH